MCQSRENNTRKTDFVGRWGGEEFLVILSNTNLKRAVEVAEKIRTLTEKTDFYLKENITISSGVGEIKDKEELNDFISRVDSYLYKAKRSGRNKTVTG
ncbi:MAG: GGDEF domain-containing protein [Brevinematia bacterium]